MSRVDISNTMVVELSKYYYKSIKQSKYLGHMQIIKEKVSIEMLKEIAGNMFGDMVKAVVDVERKIMAVGGELHSDEEALLLEDGSKQEDLWGINIYPEVKDEDWIEFDSMINLRPAQQNRTRGIENPEIRKKIIGIVNNLVKK